MENGLLLCYNKPRRTRPSSERSLLCAPFYSPISASPSKTTSTSTRSSKAASASAPGKLADERCRFVSGKALLYLTPLGCGQYDAAWYGADWDVWAGYFDLGRSYAALRQSLAGQSAYLDAALAFGQGIRVLRQDPWEMLVTFIISQRKSIPAIRTAVEQLARCCGEPLCAEGDEVFLFPTPEQLCSLTEAQLTDCGLGYRTRYIQHAAAQAAARTLDLDALAVLPDNTLFSRLLTLDGVGKKVANCVCLFGYGRTAMAPIGRLDPASHRRGIWRARPLPRLRPAGRHRAAISVLL